MAIILRSEKGAPLTIEEMDNNFQELLSRIENIEKGDVHVESIKHVHMEGDEIVFISSLEREIGRCRFSYPEFSFTGQWKQNASYAVGNIMRIEHKLWICCKPHISKDFFQADENWTLLWEGIGSEMPLIHGSLSS